MIVDIEPHALAPETNAQTMTGLLAMNAFANVMVHVPDDDGNVPVLMVIVKAVSVPAIVGAAGEVPVPVQATERADPVVTT